MREIATYSANLVVILLLFSPDRGTPLSELWPEGAEVSQLASTAELWRAGLEPEGWEALVRTIAIADDRLRITDSVAASDSDVLHARLVGDYVAEVRLRLGEANREESFRNDSSKEALVRELTSLVLQVEDKSAGSRKPTSGQRESMWAHDLLNLVLLRSAEEVGFTRTFDTVDRLYSAKPLIALNRSVIDKIDTVYPGLMAKAREYRRLANQRDSRR